MRSREWPLIIFTLLTQTAVGALFVFEGIRVLAAGQYSEATITALTNPVLAMLLPILTLSSLIALFHLGQPLRAFRVMANWRSSWLSREMLLGVLFGLGVSLCAFLQWFELGSAGIRAALAWLVILIGVGLIYGMSRLYQLRTVPVWNTLATPATFYTTALLLGALWVGAGLPILHLCLPAARALREEILNGIGTIVVALVGLQLVITALHSARLGTRNRTTGESLRILAVEHRAVFFLRLLLVLIGGILFGVYAQRIANPSAHQEFLYGIFYTAWTLLVISEILGRFLFYVSYRRVGL